MRERPIPRQRGAREGVPLVSPIYRMFATLAACAFLGACRGGPTPRRMPRAPASVAACGAAGKNIQMMVRNDSNETIRKVDVFADVYNSAGQLTSGHTSFVIRKNVGAGSHFSYRLRAERTISILRSRRNHLICGVDEVTFASGRRWRRRYPWPRP